MGVTRTTEQIARGIEVLGIATLVSGLAIAPRPRRQHPHPQPEWRRRLPDRQDPDATLKVYPGASHGLAQVAPTKDQFNADLLDFLRA
jgi:pimeloyl-ACP methyl ester carboxylesterase